MTHPVAPDPAPCPFCLSRETSAFECDVGHWAVSCHACHAIGPIATSIGMAIARWNAPPRRPATTAAAE